MAWKPAPPGASAPTERVERGGAERVVEVLRRHNIPSKIVPIQMGTSFPEAIIIEKEAVRDEQRLRVYRGINHLDESMLAQIPYALRTEHESGKPIALGSVRSEVERLAEEPTYEHLANYVDKVRPLLSEKEQARLDADLDTIERWVLELGHSVRKALMYRQIVHNGGWGTSGTAPYLSASTDFAHAAGYGSKHGGGVLVLDVPLSKLEDFDGADEELCIKGVLDPSYITAIVPHVVQRIDDAVWKEDAQYAAMRLNELMPAEGPTQEEWLELRKQKVAAREQWDEAQRAKDIEAIARRRTGRLLARFPEAVVDSQARTGTDSENYVRVKQAVYDHLKARFEKHNRAPLEMQSYRSEDPEKGHVYFKREEVDDLMLEEARRVVEYLEKRAADRESQGRA